ncbi:MAG: ATP-dependent zinc metalloprotease FtsH [candidate division KSB1 bacterium]|nr:ATP-dependent zinc metalloprotease FtsH [candidate division KSB1 bacterium]MDZ7369291.1 ATP-dependent zinc metalloprotease FtsH [candidate division KSB1 bacterium]MDZ7407325.1 ATP-dependent zinc metalloprotease FtsH [candidate division KSB1 bacterium]
MENSKSRRRQQPLGNRRMNLSLWYVVLAVLVMYALHSFFLGENVQPIEYSTFKKLVRENKIVACEITTQEITGRYKIDSPPNTETSLRNPFSLTEASPDSQTAGKKFITLRVDDPDLVKELEAAGVKYTGKIDTGWWQGILLSWILPLLILIAIWGFAFRRMNPQGGLMSIGKSKAKIYVEGKTKVTFKDVAGIDEAVEEVREVVEYLKNPEKFKSLGGCIPKGVLLVGPPGTGKTLLARAVAGEAAVPFFSLSGSDFVEMFVGVGAARVRDLFQQAQSQAPCIVFIDELDALGKARGMSPLSSHDEREQTLNQLLVEMDGFDPNSGVIIMAATNRPEILDIALLRPGRFDRQIVVERPDINGREAILKVHARKVKFAPEVDLRVIAARTPGFVGADLANVINEAALLAARSSKKQVENSDLEEAIDRVIAGLAKKNRVLNKKEKEIVAYHEAGHAIVAGSLSDVDPVHRVSIIPRGVAALGYTLQLPTEDRYLMTRTELLNRLKVLLGGRVAEEIIFKEISTGAQNDLERATAIARSMVTEYGMSPRLGPLSYAKEKRGLFIGLELGGGEPHSEKVAGEIDEEVRTIVEEAYREVTTLLTQKKPKLEQLAQMLLEKEMVEGAELEALLNGKVSQASQPATENAHQTPTPI